MGRSTSRTSAWDGHSTFRERWLALASDAQTIDICVGYASNDAIADLLKIIDGVQKDLTFHLSIGMAKFEGLPKAQFSSLLSLQRLLADKKMGTVNVVNSWPFHGKVTVFGDRSGSTRAILGSSNLSGIVNSVIQYECDIEISDAESVTTLENFVRDLRVKATEPLSDSIRITNSRSSALVNILDVREVSFSEMDSIESRRRSSEVVYEMPLKASPDQQQSNLNIYFGEGRHVGQRTWYIPRSWYEVELQPGRDWFRSSPKFPEARVHFQVVTDDGYTFQVNSSYDKQWDGQKNFRSSGNLQVLGRWIKGRLEAANVLNPGEHITDEILTQYGRRSITFTEISEDLWYMDFSV